jgi:hypothetical protein
MSSAEIVNMYSRGMQGGELPYFVGKQYGSGWLRTIGRMALPILRKLGLSAAKAATGALAATATDVLMKKVPLGQSMKTNAIAAAKETLPAIRAEAVGLMNKFDSNKTDRKRKSNTVHKSINKHKKTNGTIFQKK